MAEITAQQLHDLADLADLLEAREFIIDACLPMGPDTPPVALDVYDNRMGRRVYVGLAWHVDQWKAVEDGYYVRLRRQPRPARREEQP